MGGTKLRVFISHSTEPEDSGKESKFVDGLYAALEKEFDVVLDKETLRGGDNWRERINHWMGCCHAAVVVLSARALESDYVAYEASVVCYRNKHDASFLLLPVLRAPADRVRECERLKPSQISETHGIVDGTEEGAIASVVKALKKHKTSKAAGLLDETTNQVAEILGEARDSDVNRAAEGLDIVVDQWLPNRDIRSDLATRLIAYGLTTKARRACSEAKSKIPPKEREDLIGLLGAMWVESAAATALRECCDGKSVAATAANQTEIAECYVLRASRRFPSDSWHTGSVSWRPDSRRTEEAELAALREAVESALLEVFNTGSAKTARENLSALAAVGEHVVVFLRVSGLTRSLLGGIRTEFPAVRFFLLGADPKQFRAWTDQSLLHIEPAPSAEDEDKLITRMASARTVMEGKR